MMRRSWCSLSPCSHQQLLTHSRSVRPSSLLRGRARTVVNSAPHTETQHVEMNGRVVVTGAGPAGCLCAALLAQRGHTVAVFEQRQAPSSGTSKSRSHRSYPMVLSSRSALGFKEAGLSLPLPAPQSAIYTMPNGKLEMLWDEDSEFCRQYIVDRVDFGRMMYEATHSQYGDRISWHWGVALQDVDLENRVAIFSTVDPSAAPSQGTTINTSGAAPSDATTTTAVSYELLVGADGAGSRLRQLMQEKVPDMSTDLIFHNRSSYKTYHSLDCDQELVPGFSQHDPERNLYTFNAKDMPTLVMWRQKDGKLSGMLTRAPSYAAEELRTKLSSAYPQLSQQIVDSIVAQTSDASGQPPSPFGRLMSTTKFDGPRCVLLGDAGHPMTSTMAQGCNLALESVRVFASTLDSVSNDLERAPAAFTAARRADVQAMQTMEFMQIITSNAPGVNASPVTRIIAKATMLGSAVLTLMMHKLFPSSFPAPVYMLDGLRDARVPYKRVLETMRLHAAGLGAAITMMTALLTNAATNQVVLTLAEAS